MSCQRQRLSKRKQNVLSRTNSSEKIKTSKQCLEPEIATSSTMSSNELSKQDVWEFLRSNEEVLDEYVNNEVSQETIIRWMTRKQEKEKPESITVIQNSQIFCCETQKQVMLHDLLLLAENSEKPQLLPKLSSIVASVVEADHFRVYSKTDRETLAVIGKGDDCDGNEVELDIKEGDTAPGFAAASRQLILTNSLETDSRFPNGIGLMKDLSRPPPAAAAHSVLVAPFTKNDNQVMGVLELVRLDEQPPFSLQDLEIVKTCFVWASAALSFVDKATLNNSLNDALLEVSKAAFVGDAVSMEPVLQAISDQASSLFKADRSSIFMVDKPRGELYAQVFGVPNKEMEYYERVKESSVEVGQVGQAFKHSTEGVFYKGKPIRFPVSRGIAGHVARTGEVVLCDDVSNDSRFNDQVDLKTGYYTKTILCGPLKVKDVTSGVIQLINKKDGESFTLNDKELFTQYVEYCSKIYETVKTFLDAKYSEQQHKVTIEMLTYHRKSNESDVEEVEKAAPLPPEKERELLRLDMNTLQLSDVQHFQATFLMFSQLAHASNLSDYFNSDVVLRFILTVSKNYRPVPYHGWYHGFWVAQSMFSVISSHPEAFTGLERIALFIASLCHDLDHRGYTNNYFSQCKAPLAALYSTSIMENHHFNQTLAILQTPGVDLFSAFDAESFKKILHSMEHAIISTDLALLGKNKVKFEEVTKDKAFDWKDNSHKTVGLAILMVGCDVSATARPWEMHKVTVDWLMKEFHKQGEEEKEKGLQPLQLMDKDYQHKLPTFQIGFMKGISLPCYELLSKILPSMNVLLQGARNNIKLWAELEDSHSS